MHREMRGSQPSPVKYTLTEMVNTLKYSLLLYFTPFLSYASMHAHTHTHTHTHTCMQLLMLPAGFSLLEVE